MLQQSFSPALQPASQLLPGLESRFDITEASQLVLKYHELNPPFSTPTWSLRASDTSLISLFHDTPYIENISPRNFGSLFTQQGFGFQDQIVVDLGAGSKPFGYALARDLGARAYIGVEFCYAVRLQRGITDLPSNEKTIPYAVIYDSIKEVLESLPAQSVSFILAGIDDTFPNFNSLLTSMSEKIPHALSPQGACLLYSPVNKKYSFPTLQNISDFPSVPVYIHSQAEQA